MSATLKKIKPPKSVLRAFKRFKKWNGTNYPTPKQFLFVEGFVRTGSLKDAYYYGGYASLDVYNNNERIKKARMRRVLDSKGVQTMLMYIFGDWCERRKINAVKLAEMTLDAYNRADNVKDQLDAIRLLSQLTGHNTSVNRLY